PSLRILFRALPCTRPSGGGEVNQIETSEEKRMNKRLTAPMVVTTLACVFAGVPATSHADDSQMEVIAATRFDSSLPLTDLPLAFPHNQPLPYRRLRAVPFPSRQQDPVLQTSEGPALGMS